ncbi:MAG: tetratricopeptide repeat protein, partial [Alphaproteobacteria bacterium]
MTSHSELFVEAEAERAAGNAAAAEGLYRRLLARLPHHVKALRALGDVLRQQGKADEAASTLAAADRIDTENLARVAEGLLGLGHLQKAERSIKRALKVDPNHGEALWVLGQIHRSKGDFPSALEAYGRIPASDPRHAPAAYVRAILAGNTVWQAPSDSQPRPAPFMVIEDFLPQDSHDALLEFTFGQRNKFQPSLI